MSREKIEEMANCKECSHIEVCVLSKPGGWSSCPFYKKETDVVPKSEWISVEERLPESEKIVLVSALSKTFRYRHTLMVAHIGHHEFTTEDTGWREYEGDTEYDEENDCFWIPECWYEVNSVEDNGNWIIDSDYDVTHWMPLPEAPKKGGE
jgi:hypothetical protein